MIGIEKQREKDKLIKIITKKLEENDLDSYYLIEFIDDLNSSDIANLEIKEIFEMLTIDELKELEDK